MRKCWDGCGRIEKAFLVANKTGQLGCRAAGICYDMVAEAVRQFPTAFMVWPGWTGRGMAGVRALQQAVEVWLYRGHGYRIGLSWPRTGSALVSVIQECVELDIPILLRWDRWSMSRAARCNLSTTRPISLDPVACHFPELKLVESSASPGQMR